MIFRKKNPETFYVGYESKAPAEYRGFIRLLIIAILIACYIIASVIIANQGGFSTSVYQRDHETELEGILQEDPFPALRTFYGKDIYGNPVVKTIPLVNYGKFGADPVIEKVAEDHNHDLSRQWVTLSGRLEYNKDITMLELSEQEQSVKSVTPATPSQLRQIAAPVTDHLDSVTLHGEIIDPKCYLGVMKPAEGKPHSDCAVRCIAGGIQPMFVTHDSKGNTTYYILRGENGEAINGKILCSIGIPVAITGKLLRYDDWLILETDPSSGIVAGK